MIVIANTPTSLAENSADDLTTQICNALLVSYLDA
jgi:hypothetical protein